MSDDAHHKLTAELILSVSPTPSVEQLAQALANAATTGYTAGVKAGETALRDAVRAERYACIEIAATGAPAPDIVRAIQAREAMP